MSYHTSHNLTWQSDTPTENQVLAELAQMMHPDAPNIGQALLDETYNLINGEAAKVVRRRTAHQPPVDAITRCSLHPEMHRRRRGTVGDILPGRRPLHRALRPADVRRFQAQDTHPVGNGTNRGQIESPEDPDRGSRRLRQPPHPIEPATAHVRAVPGQRDRAPEALHAHSGPRPFRQQPQRQLQRQLRRPACPDSPATSSRVHPSQAHHHGALRHNQAPIQFPG